VRRTNPVVLVPSQAVIFNDAGLNVGVGADGKVESDDGADRISYTNRH
jgi:hypothetical protein